MFFFTKIAFRSAAPERQNQVLCPVARSSALIADTTRENHQRPLEHSHDVPQRPLQLVALQLGSVPPVSVIGCPEPAMTTCRRQPPPVCRSRRPRGSPSLASCSGAPRVPAGRRRGRRRRRCRFFHFVVLLLIAKHALALVRYGDVEPGTRQESLLLEAFAPLHSVNSVLRSVSMNLKFPSAFGAFDPLSHRYASDVVDGSENILL